MKWWRVVSPRRQIAGVIQSLQSPRTDAVLQRMAASIAAAVQPRRIVLFGSRARGDAGAESDYDIMVELEESTNLREDLGRVLAGIPPDTGSVDVVVRTAARFQERRDDPGTLDWAIAREGIVVYPADQAWKSLSAAAPGRVREPYPSPPPSVAEWTALADTDVLVAERESGIEPVPWSAVCFHAQQAAEKYLKALLAFRRIHPPRTHDTSELLKHVRQAGIALPNIDQACEQLKKYAVAARYHMDPVQLPTTAEAGLPALDAMRQIVSAARAAMQ